MGYTPKVLRTITVTIPGTLTVGSTASRWYNRTPTPLTIQTVVASLGLGSLGLPVIVDVNISESTIFTDQNKRPSIPVGSTVSAEAIPDVRTIPVGGYLTVDVDQVGSTSAGADLVVQVTY